MFMEWEATREECLLGTSSLVEVFTRWIFLLQGREEVGRVFMEWEATREECLLGTSSLVEVFTDLFWYGRVGGYHLNIPPGSDWVAMVRNSCSPHHIHNILGGGKEGERKCNS